MNCHYNQVFKWNSGSLVLAKFSKTKKEMISDKTHTFQSEGLELHRPFKDNFLNCFDNTSPAWMKLKGRSGKNQAVRK